MHHFMRHDLIQFPGLGIARCKERKGIRSASSTQGYREVVLAEELMRLGKDFDFAFAPGATHGWTGRPHYARYLLKKLVAHFDRYLGSGPRDP